MVNKICNYLPYVLINYIYFLSKILLIQSTWRNNRKHIFEKIKLGDRVLILWKNRKGVNYHKATYGTVDKFGVPYGYIYTLRLKTFIPLCLIHHYKRYYYYKQRGLQYSNVHVIKLNPWKF